MGELLGGGFFGELMYTHRNIIIIPEKELTFGTLYIDTGGRISPPKPGKVIGESSPGTREVRTFNC